MLEFVLFSAGVRMDFCKLLGVMKDWRDLCQKKIALKKV